MNKECLSDDKFGICPYVTTQKLVSGKWAFRILKSIADSPKRFNQIEKEIEITQATLSTQLKRLEKDKLICRTVYPEVPLRVEYSLTDIGKELRFVLESIEVFGNKYISYLKK